MILRSSLFFVTIVSAVKIYSYTGGITYTTEATLTVDVDTDSFAAIYDERVAVLGDYDDTGILYIKHHFFYFYWFMPFILIRICRCVGVWGYKLG